MSAIILQYHFGLGLVEIASGQILKTKIFYCAAYTRFPQATAIFRQFLLTLYVSVGGLSGRSKYQTHVISADHLHDQEPKSYCPHPVTAPPAGSATHRRSIRLSLN